MIDPELRQAMKIFKRFFDLIHQPMAIINTEGQYIYYNAESAEIDGYTVKKALGKSLLDVYPNMKEQDSTMLQSLKHGTEYPANYQIYYNALGKPIDYMHTTVPLYNVKHQIIGAIEIGRNMSGVRQLQEQVVSLNSLLYQHQEQPLPDIIFTSDVMQQVINHANILARNELPVLIVGETGTGKELFARLIHKASNRVQQSFIALNCSALPSTLIESTLFGTVKGAFTGAENRQGYLELANGGTLFLDEINSMPLEMQSKLLRFLQEKTYWRLGDSKERHSDVRIIAATNETPTDLLNNRRIRADLFYRLNVGLLKLPPLRERVEDIAILAKYFIEKHQANVTKKITGISHRAITQLKEAPWPGNVRMLENIIMRSMVMQKDDGELNHIVLDDDIFLSSLSKTTASIKIPEQSNYLVTADNLTGKVEQYEKQLIIDSLNEARGCISSAAKLLKTSRTTLQYKVKKHGINIGVVN